MSFNQMKFRIANPDQFDDLVDVLLELDWTFRNGGQEATTWKNSRRYSANFIYTCVLDNPTRHVLDYGISESYFLECADEYREMDTLGFIRDSIQELIAHANNGEDAGEADYFRALAEYAQSDNFQHPHRDIMIALANDTRTIVEVLRKDGKWAVTDTPVFTPHQQFRIGKSNLDRIVDELKAEIDGDPDKLNQTLSALTA